MSFDASTVPTTDVSPYLNPQENADYSEEDSEPSALVKEALQLPVAKDAISSNAAIVPEDHGDGVGNVMHHLAVGVGNEIVEHPLSLAGNAAAGFGLGYLTKVGLESAIWRRPTIAGLAVAGGLAAIDLISSAPGWMKSVNIASDTSGKNLEEVTAAEKHLQSLGGGMLELGVGGVAGGLAFKPSIAAATESMLSRSRAAIFGGGDKGGVAAVGESVAAGEVAAVTEAGPVVIRQPKDIVAVRFGIGEPEVAAVGEKTSVRIHPKDIIGVRFGKGEPEAAAAGKLYADGNGRPTFLTHEDGFVEIYQYTDGGPIPSHVKLVEKDSAPVIGKFTEDGVRIPLANGEEALWKGAFKEGEWVKAAEENFADPRAVLLQAEENAVRKPTYWNTNSSGEVILADEISSVAARKMESEMRVAVAPDKEARVARLFEAEAVRHAETNAARQFIQKIDGKAMTPQYVADGFTHYSQSTGWLSSQRVKTSIGHSNQYYNWEGGKLTEIYSLRRGEIDPVTVKVRDKEFFVTAPDGTEVQWKGTMSGEGIFTKAPEENFATPFGLARAMPQMRHAEAFENGKNYAAQIDSWATDPNKREFFTSSEPRQLVKLRDSSGDNYFRYDDQGNMTGWTFKSDGGAVPIELKVTEQGVLIPLPEGGELLWKGRLQNGLWRAHSSEKIQQPLSLMSHLFSNYKPA